MAASPTMATAAPVSSRVRRSEKLSRARAMPARPSDRNGAETTFTRAEAGQNPGEFIGREIGPERIDELVFGIGRLPQKEVRYTRLARGADHEVRIGQHVGVEVAREGLVPDLARVKLAGGHVMGQPAR